MSRFLSVFVVGWLVFIFPVCRWIMQNQLEKQKNRKKRKKRPNPPNGEFGLFLKKIKLSLLIGLNVDDLLAVVKAANLANAVRLHNCVTSRVGAFAHAGHREFAVIGASLISAGFRYFFLWYCHIYTSSCTYARWGRRA